MSDPLAPIGPGHRILTVEQAEERARALIARVSQPAPRLTIKAKYGNGGKSVVHLEAGAQSYDAASEVRAFLDRGAIRIVVERADPATGVDSTT